MLYRLRNAVFVYKGNLDNIWWTIDAINLQTVPLLCLVTAGHMLTSHTECNHIVKQMLAVQQL